MKTLADFGLGSDKITACVTDNAANVISAAKLMKIPRLPCGAHTLQLCVKAAFEPEAVKSLMSKLSGLIQTFNHSTKKMDGLRRVQKETNHFVPLALIQNVVTRWDSQFIMLERLLRLREDVDECITEINSKETTASKMLPIITVDEWNLLKSSYISSSQCSNVRNCSKILLIMDFLHCIQQYLRWLIRLGNSNQRLQLHMLFKWSLRRSFQCALNCNMQKISGYFFFLIR